VPGFGNEPVDFAPLIAEDVREGVEFDGCCRSLPTREFGRGVEGLSRCGQRNQGKRNSSAVSITVLAPLRAVVKLPVADCIERSLSLGEPVLSPSDCLIRRK